MLNARENRDTDAGLRRKATVLACILAVIGLIVGSLFGDRGMLHLLEQQKATEELERQLDDLRAENARLATEIRALKTDPHAIERLAREDLGLARPGETVFLIREEPAPGRP
jgi:cell division protein FtsB